MSHTTRPAASVTTPGSSAPTKPRSASSKSVPSWKGRSAVGRGHGRSLPDGPWRTYAVAYRDDASGPPPRRSAPMRRHSAPPSTTDSPMLDHRTQPRGHPDQRRRPAPRRSTRRSSMPRSCATRPRWRGTTPCACRSSGSAHGPNSTSSRSKATPRPTTRCRCSAVGASTSFALQAASIEAFETIRERLIARGAADSFVTDFGPVLSVFFRDPDGLEGEVCVANPDAVAVCPIRRGPRRPATSSPRCRSGTEHRPGMTAVGCRVGRGCRAGPSSVTCRSHRREPDAGCGNTRTGRDGNRRHPTETSHLRRPTERST